MEQQVIQSWTMNEQVYTGQPNAFGIPGMNGILADHGEVRRPDDTIALWDAIKRSRASGERGSDGVLPVLGNEHSPIAG